MDLSQVEAIKRTTLQAAADEYLRLASIHSGDVSEYYALISRAIACLEAICKLSTISAVTLADTSIQLAQVILRETTSYDYAMEVINRGVWQSRTAAIHDRNLHLRQLLVYVTSLQSLPAAEKALRSCLDDAAHVPNNASILYSLSLQGISLSRHRGLSSITKYIHYLQQAPDPQMVTLGKLVESFELVSGRQFQSAISCISSIHEDSGCPMFGVMRSLCQLTCQLALAEDAKKTQLCADQLMEALSRKDVASSSNAVFRVPLSVTGGDIKIQWLGYPEVCVLSYLAAAMADLYDQDNAGTKSARINKAIEGFKIAVSKIQSMRESATTVGPLPRRRALSSFFDSAQELALFYLATSYCFKSDWTKGYKALLRIQASKSLAHSGNKPWFVYLLGCFEQALGKLSQAEAKFTQIRQQTSPTNELYIMASLNILLIGGINSDRNILDEVSGLCKNHPSMLIRDAFMLVNLVLWDDNSLSRINDGQHISGIAQYSSMLIARLPSIVSPQIASLIAYHCAPYFSSLEKTLGIAKTGFVVTGKLNSPLWMYMMYKLVADLQTQRGNKIPEAKIQQLKDMLHRNISNGLEQYDSIGAKLQ